MAEHGSHRGERGATAAEYAILVSAIAAVVLTVVFALGGFVEDWFDDTCDEVDVATASRPETDGCDDY